MASLVLTGCAGAPAAGAAYVGITQTKPDDGPPPDIADQIAPHDNWCYETMGYAECYTHAQNVDANRLINVDPPNEYPLTPQAYRDATPPPGSY
jgi:hypothetical protein